MNPSPGSGSTSTGDLFEWTCDKCFLVLGTEAVYNSHMELVHPEESYYACEFCPATAIHWTEYYLHQCSNLDTPKRTCPHCDSTLSTKKQLSIHEEVHALQRRFSTKKLESYFAKKLEEAEDPGINWGLKPFICGVCGKPFAKMYEVEYHEKLHSEERPAPNACDKCGMYYISKNDLNKHVARDCSSDLSRRMIHEPTIR